MKKSSAIMLVLITAIIIIIFLIFYFKNNNSIDEETAKCIASKSQLFVSKTCSHCEQQKKILGNYLNLFKIVECTENAEECSENLITQIPAWIINEEKYYGAKSLKELKSLTGC